MKVTTAMHAYIQPHNSINPQDLPTEKGVRSLFFTGNSSGSSDKFWNEQGYTYVGQATVTVEVPDMHVLVDNKVEALRQQEVAIRAEAVAKCTAIQAQIQNLLAIEYTPVPAEQPGGEG